MLTPKQKAEHRAAIEGLAGLVSTIETTLERSESLPPQIASILRQLVMTDDLGRQFEAMNTLLDDTREAYMALLLAEAPNSLASYVEYLRPDEPPAPHHEFLCGKLEAVESRQIMRLMISMPPGHAKSTYCSHYFPTWYLGKRPNHKYLQAGHTQDFVEKEFGLRTRTIVDSVEFQKVFPGLLMSKSSKASGSWALDGHLGKYVAKGVGQGISGHRGNIAGVDDPYASRKDAESPATRKEVFDWFMADFSTRLLPKSPMFIVATRWHPLDLCGVLEENTKKGLGTPWEVINLPAIAEDENDPLGRAVGEALWPTFFDLAHLLDLRATLPSRDWNSLYRGKPVDENGGVLQASWIGRYKDLPIDETNDSGNIVKKNRRRTVVSVDCANKDGQRNDYTVVTVWVEDLNGIHHLAHVVRDRLNFEPMVALINSVATKWNVDAILVEDKGSGTQYIQTQTGKAPAPVVPISTNNDSKQFRFDGVTPMFQGGEVLLPERANWLADFEFELLSFPGGAHDDQVDSTSQYLAWARKGRKLGTKKLTMGTDRSTPAEQQAVHGNAWQHVNQPAKHKLGQRNSMLAGKLDRTMISTPSAKIAG